MTPTRYRCDSLRSAKAWPTCSALTGNGLYRSSDMDEGFTCGDCGLKAECEELLYGSLDSLAANKAFCPRCYSDFIIPHKPKEDAD